MQPKTVNVDNSQITYDLVPSTKPLQIQGPNLTAGFRVEVNGYSLDTGGSGDEFEIGWIQSARSVRIVRIIPNAGSGAEWHYQSDPFRDSTGGAPSPWYTHPFQTGNPVISDDPVLKLKQKIAQASNKPGTFSDDPNFPLLKDGQREYLESSGLPGNGDGARIWTRGKDEFTIWFAARNKQTGAMHCLETIPWEIDWDANITGGVTTGGAKLALASVFAEPSLKERNSNVLRLNLLPVTAHAAWNSV